MFISSTTAIEIINKTLEFRHNKKNMYNPHILTYSSRNDEFYLTRHFKKYLTFNKNRIDKIGYPTQLVKESFIIKDWQSALRYTSILKAFISENNFTQQKEKFDCHIAEITFSAREQNGSLANLAASLAGKEILYETYKDSKVPRFLNYHSTAEIYYKDTFLFKGLAILENRCDINGIEDILNYYFINCERESRDKIYELVNDNLGIKQPLGSVNNLVDEFKKRDLGMFSNYTGSSILRHPDKYFDIIHRRPTFYFSPNAPKPIVKENTDISLKNRFNVGDFTIWSDGEDTPGSLAEVLAEVILCSTREKKGIKNNKWDIQVFHSSNRPSPYCNHDKIIPEETVFTQDSFYIRLKPKSKNNMKLGLIRAIKVKLSGEILLEDLDWTEYLFKLIEHLNSKSTFKYILYIIDRLFIEGLDAEGQSRTTSVNYYFKVDNKICLEKLKNGNSSHFKILRTWEEVKEIGKWKEIPKIIFNDDLDNFYKVNRSQVQRYEFVLIREDIVNDSQKEIKANLQFGKSQNKLYYIDDI